MKEMKHGVADLLALGVLPFFGLQAFPVALAVIIWTTYDEHKDNEKELDKPMSDEWLKTIADSEDVSQKGLKFLASKLKDKGFVSLRD